MKNRAERPNRYFTYLRRLRADGRSNMYGAVPYLAAAFGLDRNESFRIICEWIDAQEEAGGQPGVRLRSPGGGASQGGNDAQGGAAQGRSAARNGGSAVREPTLFDAPPPVVAPPEPARRKPSTPARAAKGKRASGKELKPVKSAAPRGPRAA